MRTIQELRDAIEAEAEQLRLDPIHPDWSGLEKLIDSIRQEAYELALMMFVKHGKDAIPTDAKFDCNPPTKTTDEHQ